MNLKRKLALALLVSVVIITTVLFGMWQQKKGPAVPDNITLNPQQSYINIDNKKFGPYSFDYDKETNVGTSTFLGESDGSGEPDENIKINFYLNNVWKPDNVTVDDVLQILQDASKEGELTIEHGFQAPDTITQKNSYTMLATHPDVSYNLYDGYFMVFKSTDHGVYQIQFTKTLDGSDEESHKKILQWALDNMNLLKQVGNITITDDWWSTLRSSIDTTSPNPSPLTTVEAVVFSEEEIQQYKETLKGPYVAQVRTGLNGYLDGSNNGIDGDFTIKRKQEDGIISGLESFDKSYYQSKFIVIGVDDFIGGGKEVSIIFQDKPDKMFGAWVYDRPDYILRGFWEKSDWGVKEMSNITQELANYLHDEDYGI